MSRKDYQKFADMIKTATYLDETQKRRMAVDMARIFAADNDRFNRKRFFVACGVDTDD